MVSQLFFRTVIFCLFSTLAGAQTAMPYSTGFDGSAAGWTQVRKGSAGTYSWVITSFNQYAGSGCLAHNYPVGGSVPTIDWYVSPPFDFSTGGKIDSLRYAFSGFGQPSAGDTVAIYLINGSADPALATKVLLKEFRGTDYNHDNTWRLLSNLTIPAMPGQSRIAFRYETTVNWLDVRFDNLTLSCNAPAPPVDATSPSNALVCEGQVATIAATGSGTVSWFSNSTGGTALGTGTNYATPVLPAGTHTFYAEAQTCSSSLRTAITITVSTCAGLVNNNTERSCRVYPVPVSNVLNVSAPAGAIVRILNIAGQVVDEFSTTGLSSRDLSAYSPGIYYVLIAGEGQTHWFKVNKY